MQIASPTFAESVFPDGWQVGGVRLQPFSLGHAVLLQRVGNAYAEPEGFAGATLGALAVAVWICSRPASVAARARASALARSRIRWFGMRWRFQVAARHAELVTYLSAAWSMPGFDLARKPSPDAIQPGADPLHVLWMHRRRHMGDTEQEAMDCPLLRARMDHLVWAEQEGGIVIREDGETEREQRLEAARENADWDRQLRAKHAGGANG